MIEQAQSLRLILRVRVKTHIRALSGLDAGDGPHRRRGRAFTSDPFNGGVLRVRAPSTFRLNTALTKRSPGFAGPFHLGSWSLYCRVSSWPDSESWSGMEPCSSTPRIRRRLAQQWQARHRPLRRDISRCSQSLCDQARVERPAGFLSFGRSASPSFFEGNAFRTATGPTQQGRPIRQPTAHTGVRQDDPS